MHGKEVKAVAKKRVVGLGPLDRSIRSREMGIKRMLQNIQKVREKAEEQIVFIQRGIQEKEILLDALKRGSLKAPRNKKRRSCQWR